MVGGTIVVRVSALEPVVRGRFGVGVFLAVDFLVGEGVFRGGDGLPRGGAFLGVWKFSRYVELLVMTAARGRFSDPAAVAIGTHRSSVVAAEPFPRSR